MNIPFTLSFTILSGIMSGSYAAPSKFCSHWKDENIWLLFSVIAFLFMPILTIALIDTHLFHILFTFPKKLNTLLLLSGLIFGAGMVLFVISIRLLGIGTAFVFNISISTILSTAVPVLIHQPEKFMTFFGLFEAVTLLFFTCGMYYCYLAMTKQAKENSKKNSFQRKKGFLLAIISGILVSAQGISFSLASPLIMQHHYAASKFALGNLIWLPMYIGAFLVYSFYFLNKSYKQNSLKYVLLRSSIKNIAWVTAMGIVYFLAIIFLGYATIQLETLGTAITWPLSTLIIIMTSNIWGIILGDWKHAKPVAFRNMHVSFIYFCLAIASLAAALYFII